jgi:hypothetical protein
MSIRFDTLSNSHYVLDGDVLTVVRDSHHPLGSERIEGASLTRVTGNGGVEIATPKGPVFTSPVVEGMPRIQQALLAQIGLDAPAKNRLHDRESTPIHFRSAGGTDVPVVANRCTCGRLVDVSLKGTYYVCRVAGDSANGYELLHVACA